MTDEALWAVGRGCGITALAFLTISVGLGIATRSGRPLLALPRFAVSDVHRFTALAGTLLVVLHVTLLFLDPYAQLRLVDFVVPFLGEYRPLWQGIGTLGFDLMLVIVVTSLLRQRIGVRGFRAIHWATYALWPIAFTHALGNGTDAYRVWFVAFAGGCAAIVGAALLWRVRSGFAEYADARVSERAR
ncbi:ferric reductase-like transmembrane domain-containing protein [Mycobacterium sp. 3519A]|uniref:ferric reductase-like transmembrane domain-containing protein n=1 Tax=Mycobacterium sp. 3519A TaxID=2057184 RepID=UPI000C7A19DF|nr:ferric reductase-like transmembrane domain-containing protein [Mycobacterium sp. 3519A]